MIGEGRGMVVEKTRNDGTRSIIHPSGMMGRDIIPHNGASEVRVEQLLRAEGRGMMGERARERLAQHRLHALFCGFGVEGRKAHRGLES